MPSTSGLVRAADRKVAHPAKKASPAGSDRAATGCLPARSQSSMCGVGPPDVDGSIAPTAGRRHHRIEVLPQAGVFRREAMHRDGVIVDTPVEQFLAQCRNAKRAAFMSLLGTQS